MNQYTIEKAREEDLVKLASIERSAARLFPDHVITPEERVSVVPLGQLVEAMQQGRLWVALTQEQQPVGFIIVVREADTAFIVEVDVLPEHQVRGLGRALIQRVVCWARKEGLPRVTLTTFSDVPWNAPFYERLGFCRIDRSQLTVELARKLDDEKHRGLRGRIAMELHIESMLTRK
ncbi:MAG: GNAT family N-acetyltransferase [Zhongshania sp.]|uniref:GNAT family N-acetyltransferase n=1 Tax=Zhongshania sp. TaxID=1971902 RepID=UPI00260323A9|nr:GNAT family N-acetyltransferase [Zhongshania sp.]MDF1693331.1 GNAT family N-acetyltransferase [Zhongshania sp.]